MTDYDVVVVGSGFGGAVTALRLTEKGYRVAVMEAGRRFADEEFASTSWDVRRFLWAPRLGCFGIQRIHRLPDVTVLAGAGVGGGSLVYANTLYRPDPAFYDDVATAYGDELRSLAAAGCTYVQMDDTNLAYLCDDKMREAARSRGDDPDELPHRYASFINRVVAQKPEGMTLAMHLCRGNFKSTWAAQGGYEPVAEALLSEMDVDAYFLEYDDARSGDLKSRCAICPRARRWCSASCLPRRGAIRRGSSSSTRTGEPNCLSGR